MTTITVQTPVKVASPYAARLAAAVFYRTLTWFRHTSAQRADRQSRADRIREAAAVRDYAQRFASEDPRFAADLLAAADRHELPD
jgi:hypothetical protein